MLSVTLYLRMFTSSYEDLLLCRIYEQHILLAEHSGRNWTLCDELLMGISARLGKGRQA